MKAALVFLVLIGLGQSWCESDDFKAFKIQYNKNYKDNEEAERLKIYHNNRQMINSHNKRYAAGEETFEMGVNEFTDLRPEEFERLYLSSLNVTDLKSDIDYIFNPSPNVGISNSIDWRSRGAVTRVKYQGSCGSCWAFSTTGALESHHFIKTRKLVSLSEQNLVDCARGFQYNNRGCSGGWPASALTYVKNNGGINTNRSYPYEAKDNKCRFNKNNIGAKVTRVVGIQKGSESQLAKAVAEKGPVSVCVDASQFQFYKGGVFNRASCTRSVNHAVLVVGYGTSKNAGDFWIVKNSWGTSWGDKGYIRMARNRRNQCQIANFAVYPVV